MEDAIEEKTSEIKCAVRALGSKLKEGDNSQLLYWVIPCFLACTPRPLRYHPRYGGSRKPLPPEATDLVRDWACYDSHGIGESPCSR